MTYSLGRKSQAELVGVHPDVAFATRESIKITVQDFMVFDGLRTVAEQREYVRRGASQTMNSMHLPQRDGYGHAVDLVPWINGMPRWETEPCYRIAEAMHKVCKTHSIRMTWGQVWDSLLTDLDARNLKREAEAYVERRRRIGKRAFLDTVHYQKA